MSDLDVVRDEKREVQCLYKYADFILAPGYNERDISTIMKQMKIVHQGGFTPEERMTFRPAIWNDLLQTSRSVVQVLQTSHAAETATPANEVRHSDITFLSCHRKLLIGELGVHYEPSGHHR